MGSGKAFGYKLKEYSLVEKDFQELLEETSAIVGGSYALSAYIEDHLCKAFECNDLDIFIEKDESNAIKKIMNYLIANKYQRRYPLNFEQYYNSDNIEKVLEYCLEDKKIQIIVLNTTFKEHQKTFDLDCCKAYWCNYKKRVIIGEDVLNMKTIINLKYLNDNTLSRCNKYIKRGFSIYFNKRDISEALKLAYYLNLDISQLKSFLKNFK